MIGQTLPWLDYWLGPQSGAYTPFSYGYADPMAPRDPGASPYAVPTMQYAASEQPTPMQGNYGAGYNANVLNDIAGFLADANVPAPPAPGYTQGDMGLLQQGVTDLYQEHLGRAPADYWRDRWIEETRGDLDQIEQGIWSSEEYQARHDVDPGVAAIYQELLGRAPEAYWANRWMAETGGDLEAIRQGVMGSPEYLARTG